jgi:ADP-ribose pyrophosphatase YjhB (NUDIX family)
MKPAPSMSTSLVSLASLVSAFNPVVPQVRLAAIIARKNQLLVVEHRKRGQRYWVLPGGRLQGNETLEAALRRELKEELAVDVRVGSLVIVSEMVAPDRHVVNLMFQAEIGEGIEPRLDATDPVLAGWQWVAVNRLPRMDFRPPIADPLRAVIRDGFAGPVRLLGDTWRPESS